MRGMEKYMCQCCKIQHEGKPEYYIVEDYIHKALKSKPDMTPRQYQDLYNKASFGLCRSAINILLFPSANVQKEIEDIKNH